MKKILIVFGTRPEAIKMAPLVKILQNKINFSVKICVTAQHREMLDQVLNLFKIKPDYDLNIMKPNQDLYDISSNILLGIKSVLDDFNPDLVLVHGDTSTTFMASLASYYRKIAVGHVEAGLRTGNIYSPWPEEANRKMAGVLTTYHFAPTQQSKKNLLKENIKEKQIIVTGNTVIDALFLILEKIKQTHYIKVGILQNIMQYYPLNKDRRIILMTGHRRENFGNTFIQICEAIKILANNNPDIDIVYPVHLNPNVQEPAKRILSHINNIYLLPPLDYEVFAYLMYKSYLIVTDSGGIQEEAPSLGKPVLITRETTERPEAIISGTVKLVGTDRNKIVSETQYLLDNETAYSKMSKAHNPYGNGKASEKIANFIEEKL